VKSLRLSWPLSHKLLNNQAIFRKSGHIFHRIFNILFFFERPTIIDGHSRCKALDHICGELFSCTFVVLNNVSSSMLNYRKTFVTFLMFFSRKSKGIKSVRVRPNSWISMNSMNSEYQQIFLWKIHSFVFKRLLYTRTQQRNARIEPSDLFSALLSVN